MLKGYLEPDKEYDSYMSPQGRMQTALARQLAEGATKSEPVYGWGQALAKVLSGAAAGYMAGHNADQAEENMKAAPGELANALATAGGKQWSNPDTGEQVIGDNQMQNLGRLGSGSDNPFVQKEAGDLVLDDVKNQQKQKLIDALYGAKEKLKNPTTPATTSSQPSQPSGGSVLLNAGPKLTGDPTIDNAAKKAFGKKQGEADQAAPNQARSKEKLDKIFSSLSDRFTQLKDMGGTPEQGAIAALSNTEGVDLPFGLQTPGGQDIARLRGTPEQGVRDQIEGDIGDIKAEYMKASGLSSKQLDSNQEAKQFMKSLPNLMKQSGANQQRIADMSERFANSIAKAKIESQQGGLPQSTPVSGGVPAAHIDALKANPDKAADFDAKYGPGSAAKILGTGPQSNAAPIDGPNPVIDIAGQGGPIETMEAPGAEQLTSPKVQDAVSPVNIQAFRQKLLASGQSPQAVDAYLRSKGLM